MYRPTVTPWQRHKRAIGYLSTLTIASPDFTVSQAHRALTAVLDYSRLPTTPHPQSLPVLKRWLREAPRGQWCVYWEGFLRADIWEEQTTGVAPGDYPAHIVGPMLYLAYEAGDVDLFQVRVGPLPPKGQCGTFRYWARKR